MNPFNSMAGTQSEVKTGTNRYTGLAAARLVAVNPNQAELRTLLNNPEMEWNPEYKSVTDDKGTIKFPITFWVQHADDSKNFFTTMTIYMSEALIQSKNGKNKFINKLGQISYYAANAEELMNNEKISWYNKEGIRPLHIGEEALYNLMQKIMRFDPTAEGADWLTAMNEANVTIDRLCKGDVSGLRQFINYANSENEEKQRNCFICLYCVKRKDVTENGETTTKFYQNILAKPEAWFKTTNCEVTPNIKERLRSTIADKKEQGYELTQSLYTIDFQDFKEEDCDNSAPTEAATAAPAQNWV